ncbi:MAG: lysophospholipid acyltransferase family protein [Pseudomonadota bacterium]
MKDNHATPKAILRLTGLVCWTLVLLLPSLGGQLLTGRAPRKITHLWYRGACTLLGLDIEMSGEPLKATPVLFVANHISYLDILALGASIDTGFIAKSEVGRWPVIGYLARLARTVFVERSKRSSSGRQRDAIIERLAGGENLVLFAEGTSSDGTEVLPFKSTLFSAVEAKSLTDHVALQPLTIAYNRQGCAWYGDMEFVPHLWQMLGQPRTGVNVLLHDALPVSTVTNRKNLAAAAQRIVADGLHQMRSSSRTDAIPHEAAGLVARSSGNRQQPITSRP